MMDTRILKLGKKVLNRPHPWGLSSAHGSYKLWINSVVKIIGRCSGVVSGNGGFLTGSFGLFA